MSLDAQLKVFTLLRVDTSHGVVQYRRACPAAHQGPVTHVLLHGIGSASASWLAQLLQARSSTAPACHVLAWDAPGYGASDPLPMESPTALDYANRFWAWLDAVDANTQGPLTLVGHSLGALMAARAALLAPARVARLVLLAPAQGYGSATAAVREQKLSDRLANLAQLGPAGMASKRASAMLSVAASSEQLAFVEQVMAGIVPHGYTQAARMLAGGELQADLRLARCAVTIASGSADTVTPSDACRALAAAVNAPYVSLGAVGHSCPLEAAATVNSLIGLGGVAP
jgi:pimeloyl-ACP methyl ester carboxylesterase